MYWSIAKGCSVYTNLVIVNEHDFGEGLHSVNSEPYFYESSYNYTDRPSTLYVDEFGRCRHVIKEGDTDNAPNTWKCCDMCKNLTQSEVCSILNFKSKFDGTMKEV